MSERELLERHAPILRFDRFEPYTATAVEALLAVGEDPTATLRCELWREGEARPYARAGQAPSPVQLVLREPGGSYPDATPWRRGDCLRIARPDGPPDYRRAGALEQERNGQKVYGRVVRRPDGWWLQYWLFYFFNDRVNPDSGPFVHQGDWEMVQVRVPPAADNPDSPASRPDVVTFSQHFSAQRRRWTLTRRRGSRPVVFIGRGTHACYPGRSWLGSWTVDIRDGGYEVADAELVDISDEPAFTAWPGRWGGDPTSPGGLGPRVAWATPERYHREAVGLLLGVVRTLPQWLRGAAAGLGRRLARALMKPVDFYREARPPAGPPSEPAHAGALRRVRSVARRLPWPRSRARRAVSAGWEDAQRGIARVEVQVRDFGWSLAIAYVIMRIRPEGRPQRVYTWPVAGAVPGEGGFRFAAEIPWTLDPGVPHRIEVRAMPATTYGQLRVGKAKLLPQP